MTLMQARNTEGLTRDDRIAFVVMQFASTPWNLFDIAADVLQREYEYLPLRADLVVDNAIPDDEKGPTHIWTLIQAAEFVLVDVTNWNVNVYIELGVAAAWARTSRKRRPSLGVIGAETRSPPGRQGGTSKDDLPFDIRYLRVHGYSLTGTRKKVEASIAQAVRDAHEHRTQHAIRIFHRNELEFEIGTRDRTTGRAGKELLDELPAPVTAVLYDPGAAWLATRYLYHLSALVGEELAGVTGFPACPDLVGAATVPDHLISEPLRPFAHRAVDQLLAVVKARDDRVAQALDVASFREIDRRLVAARALGLPAEKRNSAETEVLSTTLRDIALSTAPAPRYPWWPRAVAAVTRLTRLHAISVSPTALNTVDRIRRSTTTGRTSPVRTISTLGGAYYLAYSIATLKHLRSPYSAGAAGLFDTTLQGQPADSPPSATLARYEAGLGVLALEPTFLFTVEHPFHFRVLLELLSDENRRYAAECIVNYQALKAVWGDALWSHFAWFRDQLPVVGNVVPSGRRVIDLHQHYIGFGRTPHTSSFMRMEFEDSVELSPTRWWPTDLHTPTGLPTTLRNAPNSTAAAGAALSRQRLLGSLWRGEENPDGLAVAAGELYAWDGTAGPESVAAAMWDVYRWPALGFPASVVAELQCGVWILETLKLRQREASADQRIAVQAGHVLAVALLYLAEYLGDGGDGVGGLYVTLDRLGTQVEGRRMSTNLVRLKRRVDDLTAQLRSYLPCQ